MFLLYNNKCDSPHVHYGWIAPTRINIWTDLNYGLPLHSAALYFETTLKLQNYKRLTFNLGLVFTLKPNFTFKPTVEEGKHLQDCVFEINWP